jgi:hypothetical protein
MLHKWVRDIFRNAAVLGKYYEPWALVRDDSAEQRIFEILERLSSVSVRVPFEAELTRGRIVG